MINAMANKQVMYYALQTNKQYPIYERDENGEIIYDEIDGDLVPRESGNWETQYERPVKFYGNINSGNVGVTIARAYGISTGDFEAVLCMHKGELPINERSLIWYANKPKYISEGDGEVAEIYSDDGSQIITEGGEIIEIEYSTFHVDPKSADYRVKRVPPCLDEIIYLLGKQDNNGEEDD